MCFYFKNKDISESPQNFERWCIFNVREKIEAMIKKLELFYVCINKDNTQVFPSLYDFLCANELKHTVNVKCDIAKHLNDAVSLLCRIKWNDMLFNKIISL
jgi:phosphosulfolactate phosphohydrolase-like enzyme